MATPETSPSTASPAKAAAPARTRRLLEGPIGPTLAALAAPNIVVSAAQMAVAIADAWGDPERPMDADAVRAKFDRLAAGAGMAADRAQAIAEAILALPRSGDGAAVHAALRHAATG